MTEHIGVGGEWKVKAAEWIGVGGEWKAIAAEWIGVGGEWKVAFVALTVSSTLPYGSDSGFPLSGRVYTDLNTVTVSGGSGNYTYLWEHVSTASGPTPTINDATAAQTTWTTIATDGVPAVSTWTLTVTDGTYGVTATATVDVTLEWGSLT